MFLFYYICHCVDDLFLKHLNVLQRYDCTYYYVRYLFYVCRSSVTRMSSDQKQNVITKTSEEERATLDANLSHLSSSREEEEKTPVTSPTTQDAETGTWRLHSHHTSAAAVGHSGFKFDWIVLLYSVSFESSLFLSFFLWRAENYRSFVSCNGMFSKKWFCCPKVSSVSVQPCVFYFYTLGKTRAAEYVALGSRGVNDVQLQ